MRVTCGGVDYGGHRGKEVMQFCKPRFSRGVFAFMGHTDVKASIAPRVAGRSKHDHGKIFKVGVHQAGDVIASHMQTEDIGPGYMHYPADDAYNEEYFKQLTAEQRDKSGRWVKKRARNEAWDVRRYAYCSLFVAGIDIELLAQRGPMLVSSEPSRTKKKRSVTPSNYMDEF